MAQIGLKAIRYAVQAGDESYGTPASIGKAVSCSVAVNNSDAKLYADDALVESDSAFVNATVSLVIADDDIVTMATILGRTPDETTGEVIRSANDVAPYVGLGRVIPKMINGVRKYKAEFLAKVKFKEPSQDDATKGESVEFKTVSLEGDSSSLADGSWSKTLTFDTEALAVSYLDDCFGVV